MRLASFLILTALLSNAQTTSPPLRPLWASYAPGAMQPYPGLNLEDMHVYSDRQGNVWIAGTTGAPDLPVTAGAIQRALSGGDCRFRPCTDDYVIKLDPEGRILYATYFGGEDDNTVDSMTVDSSGNLYLVGTGTVPLLGRSLSETGYPYIAKFNPQGGLIFSSRLDVQVGASIAVDRGGSLYVASGSLPAPERSGVHIVLLGGEKAIVLRIPANEVLAFAADIRMPGVFYAGTDRGILKSVDNGLSWQGANTEVPADSMPASLAQSRIETIVIDPANQKVLYSSGGQGVYKSLDGGVTWRRSAAGLEDVGSIRQLLVDPHNSSFVYLVDRMWGVWRTQDSGATWQATGLNTRAAGQAPLFPEQLLADPTRPGTLIALLGVGIALSRDYGETWNWFPRTHNPVAIDAAGVWYATGPGPEVDLLVSADGGNSWTRRPAGGQGLGNFVADPGRAGVLYGVSVPGAVQATSDGGLTWSGIPEVPAVYNDDLLSTGAGVAVRIRAFREDFQVVKIAADGTAVLWRKVLGGLGDESVKAIVVDSTDRVWLTGRTTSGDFPTVNPRHAQRGGLADAFVATLSGQGALLFSTYSGGEQDNTGTGLAADESGSVYAIGWQLVSPPLEEGIVAGYVTKYTAGGGEVAWSVDLPRTTPRAVTVASGGAVYVTGEISGPGLASSGAFQKGLAGSTDAFLAKISSIGGMEYLTYYGGTEGEGGTGVAALPDGDVALTGSTYSVDLPLVNPFQPQPGYSWASRWTERPMGAPLLLSDSVVNGLSFRPANDLGGTIAPGAIVSLFGSNLAAGVAHATSLPLPRRLLGTTVTMNGVPAPLFYVSPQQVNAQVPFEVAPGTIMVQVRRGDQLTQGQRTGVSLASPGLFGVAFHADGTTAAYGYAPLHAGERAILYATGLGELERPVATGSAFAESDRTMQEVTVKLDGRPATVEYAGGAPGYVGLYQINFVVPEMPAGRSSVVVSEGGVDTNGAVAWVGP